MVEPFSVILIESIAPFQYFTLGICLKIFFLSHFIFNHLTFNILCFKYSNIQSQKKCDYKSKSLRWCDQRCRRVYGPGWPQRGRGGGPAGPPPGGRAGDSAGQASGKYLWGVGCCIV